MVVFNPFTGNFDITGANTALSNLDTTAINTSLISDTDSTDDLGSSAKKWSKLYVDDIVLGDTPTISTESNANLSLVPNGTGYTIIGDAGVTSHTFNTNDDLLVSGRLEVDGIAYFDNNVGIGVDTPNSRLHISQANGAGDVALSIQNAATTASESTSIIFINTTGTTPHAQLKATRVDAQNSNFSFNVLTANSLQERFSIDAAEGIFNKTGVDYNFRWAGDTDANLLFTDAGTDRVGIGDAAPGEKLDVAGNINATGVLKIDDVQVVSNRVIDARIDDAPNSGDATTDGIIAAIQSILQTHGLAAAA